MSRNIFYIGAAVILAVVIAGVYFFNLGHADLKSSDPDFNLSAIELYDDFSSDETKANESYVNKIIDVSGQVIAKNTTTEGGINISLDSGDPFGKVICNFSKEEAATIDTVVLEDLVTIRGICNGMLLDVLLNDCVLVEKQ